MNNAAHRSDSEYENCESIAYEETSMSHTLDNLSQSSTESEESLASTVYGENFMDVVKSRELQPYSGEPEVSNSKASMLLFTLQFLSCSCCMKYKTLLLYPYTFYRTCILLISYTNNTIFTDFLIIFYL